MVIKDQRPAHYRGDDQDRRALNPVSTSMVSSRFKPIKFLQQKDEQESTRAGSSPVVHYRVRQQARKPRVPLDIVPNRLSPDNGIDSRDVKISERVMGSLAVICSLLIPFDKVRTDEEKTQDGARAD